MTRGWPSSFGKALALLTCVAMLPHEFMRTICERYQRRIIRKPTFSHQPPPPRPETETTLAKTTVLTSTQPKATMFARLPAEVRQMIYQYVMGGEVLNVEFVNDLDKYDRYVARCRRAGCLWNFSKTCRLAYVDSIETLYRRNTFNLDPTTLRILSSMASPPLLSLITSIYLNYDGYIYVYSPTPTSFLTDMDLDPMGKDKAFPDLEPDPYWLEFLSFLAKMKALRDLHLDIYSWEYVVSEQRAFAPLIEMNWVSKRHIQISREVCYVLKPPRVENGEGGLVIVRKGEPWCWQQCFENSWRE